MKKIMSFILSSVLALSMCLSVSAASTVYSYNRYNANIDYDAIVKDGKLYVPVCKVAFYGMVKSSEDTLKGTVTIEALGRSGYFTLTAGSNTARKNGVNIVISGTPFMANGVMYGPADFIGEQLGLSINYDSANNMVTISDTGDGKISTVTEQQASANPGEKMVTKSELEAAGKGPDSVNWRYQQDYLANKPIPESALIYKPKTQNKASSSSSSNSSYKPSDKGIIGDIFSPITDTFDALFGKGSSDYYLEHGHL